MIGPWLRPKGAHVAARNLDQIRRIALSARNFLGIEEVRINMIDLLENRLRRVGIHYHVVDPSRIPGEAARAIPEEGIILITSRAHNAVHDGDPRHQLLVPHELGHFALKHSAFFSRTTSSESHMALEDSEVQADLFSHEFAMPIDMVQRHCRSLDSIQNVFNVQRLDARIRRDKLQIEGLITW